MARSTLLEMCIIAVMSLPEERLGELLPALTALAEPYADTLEANDDLNRCIHACLQTHVDILERSSHTQDA